MNKKSPLEKSIVNTLREPFYLNVVKYLNTEDRWYPIMISKWAGSSHLREAVKIRKEAAVYLHKQGNSEWKDGKNIKTVKVTLYK